MQDALSLHEAVSECEADKVSLEGQLRQAQDQLQAQGNALNSHLHTAQEVPFPWPLPASAIIAALQCFGSCKPAGCHSSW